MLKNIDKLILSDQRWVSDRAEAAKAIFQQYEKGNITAKTYETLLRRLIDRRILDMDFNPRFQKLREELVSCIQILLDRIRR